MRAVVMRETGDPDVLRVEDVERPEPGDGEVLIRIHAASVNPIDWKYRRGLSPKQLPAVLGSDISGTVELSRADGFADRDEVFGFAASGAYAEFARAPATLIANKPAGLSHEQGGGTARRCPHGVAGTVRPRRAHPRTDGADRGRRRRGRSPRGAIRQARRSTRDRDRVIAQPRLRARPRGG